jgi:hypothetical protein
MREYSVLDIDRNLVKFGKISSRELMEMAKLIWNNNKN